MDKTFQQKLENHQEKPSALAWERLENQLPSRSRKKRGFIWAAAAVLVVLWSIGALYWSNDSTISKENLLAVEEQKPASEPVSSPDLVPSEIQPEETNSTQGESNAASQTQQAGKLDPATPHQTPANLNTSTAKKLLAEAADPVEIKPPQKTEITREESQPIGVEKSLPELQPVHGNPTIAELNPYHPEVPTYTVTIRSDGLKENKGLVANLEKTVGQLEGLTEKVDLFANLQDAKNGLYAKLTSKKERVSENP
ncbi:hypothetical protein [Algoriphagus sp.]|uniref:hypothetical protein n=1 Tax=Algoriphagus sp. TaxID=1872435 RepID=UPI00262284F7|nr:hypothetical protein [Algoriphagus sp.]